MSTRTSKGGKAQRMREPAHPGEILRDQYFTPLGINVTAAAEALGVSRKHVSAVLNGRASINPDLAVRLGIAFNVDAVFWLNMQAQYDVWVEEQKERPDVKVLAPGKPASGD